MYLGGSDMKKFLAIVTLLVCMLTATTVFAADNPDSEGIKAFREALTSDSDALERIFRQDILFASPFVQAELEILGTVENNAFKSTGEFSLWLYRDDGSVTEKIIPFYLTQNGKDMTIYFKSDKQWQKFTTPTLAADVMDMITTPNEAEIEEIIADTKEVQILQENDNRRIMRVTLDGNRMADSLKSKAEKNPEATADATQESTVNYLDTALRNANVWYLWTIDKRDWHTVAMQYNFSGIIQELARTALTNSNQQWTDEISQILETIAYYSELRAYTTYPADPAAKKKFEIPKNVLKAKEINNLISSDIATK